MPAETGIWVTGASGWIGRNVCSILQQSGNVVVACDLVNPDEEALSFLKFDITAPPAVDSKEVQSLRTLAKKWMIIHCAGLAHRPVETDAVKAAMDQVNRVGTQKCLDWAKSIGVQRFVYLSSIAFYDWKKIGSAAADELASLCAETAYARSKLAGEELVLASGLDGRVLRLATVFGEGDSANFSKLAQALHQRRFILPGKGRAQKSVIPVDMAAYCIASTALKDSWTETVLNLGLSHAPTLKEICQAFQSSCGCPAPIVLPLPVLKILARVGDGLAKIKPSFPLTRLVLGKLTSSTQVDCSKAAFLFPELDQTSFSDALNRHADGYRNANNPKDC